MTTVQARSADDVWRPVLASSARAEVGFSFEHAVNFELDGEVLTLVVMNGRRAPGALITSASTFARCARGSPVSITPDRVRIAGLHVVASQCSYYSCQAMPPAAVRVIEVDVLREALRRSAVPGSFWPAKRPSPLDLVVRERLIAGSRRLQDALAVGLRGRPTGPTDAAEPAPAVHDLLGLGIGLTPSGDDYLVGVLAALHHLRTAAPITAPLTSTLGALVTEALHAQRAVTTRVSRSFLLAAAGGRFHEDISWAATAALTAPGAVDAAFRRAAAVGSTSGTDALFGLVDTLSTWAAYGPLDSARMGG